MIRIDEIYYNTFLPVIQRCNTCAMHWFDPFGSTKLKDMCSTPAINNLNNDAVRYLFWDQEPLYKSALDQVLPVFSTTYDGQLHLITSEKDSDTVAWAAATYNCKTH